MASKSAVAASLAKGTCVSSGGSSPKNGPASPHSGTGPCDISPSTASAQYRFAKNPRETIFRAVTNQLEHKIGHLNPRLQWQFICDFAKVPRDSSITTEVFSDVVKCFGSGIQLQACDVNLMFGTAEDITYNGYMLWSSENLC
jgi:hypothetical protein